MDSKTIVFELLKAAGHAPRSGIDVRKSDLDEVGLFLSPVVTRGDALSRRMLAKLIRRIRASNKPLATVLLVKVKALTAKEVH